MNMNTEASVTPNGPQRWTKHESAWFRLPLDVTDDLQAAHCANFEFAVRRMLQHPEVVAAMLDGAAVSVAVCIEDRALVEPTVQG